MYIIFGYMWVGVSIAEMTRLANHGDRAGLSGDDALNDWRLILHDGDPSTVPFGEFDLQLRIEGAFAIDTANARIDELEFGQQL